MNYVCTVPRCGRVYEAPEDQGRNEPCPPCWRQGWRHPWYSFTPFRVEPESERHASLEKP